MPVAALRFGNKGVLVVSSGVTPGFSLLCAPGSRPGAAEVERLLQAPAPRDAQLARDAQLVRISHRPAEAEGWLELLASGLTFDLAGLAPAAPAPRPAVAHRFNVPEALANQALEAVSLVPGDHVSAAGGQVAVVRMMAGIAARLAKLPGVRAVCWHPLASWMEAGYFARIVSAWLAGGVFPALGLTTFQSAGKGQLLTLGMACFTGQELRVEVGPGERRSETTKLAVRAVDLLVRHGPVHERMTLVGPVGEPLMVEPEPGGKVLRLWRDA